MRKAKTKKLFWAFIVWIVGSIAFVHFFVPRLITELRNPLVEFVKSEHLTAPKETFSESKNDGRTFTFLGYHEDEQSAHISYSETDTAKATIILIHGIRGTKEHFVGLSQKLTAAGYNTIALDLRAHGESQGVHCTFGVHEKFDIQSLLDFARSDLDIVDNIGVWGQSLGASVALQALALDERLQFGIIESTFSDYETIANDYVDYFAHANIETFTNYVVYRSGKIAGFDPYDARPIEKCKEIEQPVLMVHGDEDKRIDIAYGKANYKNLKSENKAFLEIKGANHLNVWEVGGEAYFTKVCNFIDDALDKDK